MKERQRASKLAEQLSELTRQLQYSETKNQQLSAQLLLLQDLIRRMAEKVSSTNDSHR